MNKILKYALLSLAVLAVIALAAVAYVAATFNPNEYKAQIIKAVKDSKQRDLRLDGDIKLSFFPSIGASVSKVSLSEFRSDNEFAAIDSARVSMRWR
jgi:AsmA protein